MRRLVVGLALAAISTSLHSQQLTLPLEADSVRFAVIGDMGTGKRLQFDVAATMEKFRHVVPFEFVITLGDNIYGGNSADDYRRKFELPYKPLLDAGVRFYASLGNHDSPNQRVYKPFNMGGQQYYTYRKGHVQFFALDSTYMSPLQLSWLEKELETSSADWKIGYLHHPLYSSGAYHGSALELRKVLEPLFVKYGVQVVFAGHEHVYERVKLQKGVSHFVEGASGQLRRGNLRKSTGLTAVGYDQDQSFILVEIAGDALHFQAISRTGKTVDSGVIQRGVRGPRDAVPTTPAQPSGAGGPKAPN
jgi:predicted phosphodiesterase